MRSAPTLKIWITPRSSVAMLEKLALLKIASCNAPVFSTTACRRVSLMTSRLPGSSASRTFFCFIFLRSAAQLFLEAGGQFRKNDRLRQKGLSADQAATAVNFCFGDGRG